MRAHTPTLTALFLAALMTLPAQAPAADSELYQALGERSGISTIVKDLLGRIADDDRIAPQFKGIDVRRFHRNLTDQLCTLSGGPCTYSGKDMRSVHAGMGVTETQFNALVEQLIRAMEEEGVPTWAQNQLLAELVPLHDRIVDVPARE
ncbi:group 1 truncated hemoglobin [Halovibrio salipaludis]|uniref:Group 1 truncated hemoglobin n=1 Tax=Halovibrio salipaludis TaxID=2032626 RepID=A0A2A2FAU7_9GAMM|nr:group 1 truncated hemoglobin [Halovibrio salipaludis]PAU81742.1 group 1 truncated hemoglobin [Halovibrio salipaludis]